MSNRYGLKRVFKAAQYSKQGLIDGYRGEEAIRQETFLLLLSIPLAIFLADSFLEFALLVGSVLLIIVVELLNSAIEAVVDRFGDEIHELSRQAKDMGSAAVAVTALITFMLWLGLVLSKF